MTATPSVRRTPSKAAVVRREYDRLASVYDRKWERYVDATLGPVVEALQLEGTERLLDAPCGTGELERRFLHEWPGLQVVGIDLSHEMLLHADAKTAGEKVAWMQANVERLPFADEAFDVVVCANSFHYFPAPESALRELRRTLKRQGRLVLLDWCDDFLMCKLCSVWLRWCDPAFHRTYSLKACRELLQAAGFTVEHSRRFRVGWVWGLMRLVCRSQCV
ncbi:MAG: class I SAM-dependent methyltransferase [Planctomycetes bacterium]|nr:class I SAM-dependent methyltransferase [Planctomycetota bacterium]